MRNPAPERSLSHRAVSKVESNIVFQTCISESHRGFVLWNIEVNSERVYVKRSTGNYKNIATFFILFQFVQFFSFVYFSLKKIMSLFMPCLTLWSVTLKGCFCQK